jgi:hypothetical protein
MFSVTERLAFAVYKKISLIYILVILSEILMVLNWKHNFKNRIGE